MTFYNLVYSCLQRRQDERHYSPLEAERCRQHKKAACRLLEFEEPGLNRPPLPLDYEPPSLSSASSASPPPPQQNTSYFKTQVLSPDSLFTAKFVVYDDKKEEDYGPASQDKYPRTRKSHGHFPLANLKLQQPPCQPCPVLATHSSHPWPKPTVLFTKQASPRPCQANQACTVLATGKVKVKEGKMKQTPCP